MHWACWFVFAGLAAAQAWDPQVSNSKASLRGLSAVDAKVAWASGSGGTFLHTSDGGATWQAGQVPDAGTLDFRGIRAIDARTVYLLSSGPGDKSQIYKTRDGGATWKRQFTNPDTKGFLDAIAFWDARHGMVLGDPVDGAFSIFTTDDGGENWTRKTGPAAVANEGAFAASNTCLTVRGKQEAWFGSGGVGGARVFHTKDGGRTWTISASGIRNDSASAGIFSVAFMNGKTGIAVGGDYAKDKEDRLNAARSDSAGATWGAATGPKGFRSAVAYVPKRKLWIAAGTSGSDVSTDGGKTWKTFDTGSFNAISFTTDGTGWAAGAGGRIARFRK